MTQFWFAASTEEFPPSAMLAQAEAAEAAGFDAIGCSDHFAPWWPDGAATQAWVTLAAIGRRTTRPLFTAVTPIVHHYSSSCVAFHLRDEATALSSSAVRLKPAWSTTSPGVRPCFSHSSR